MFHFLYSISMCVCMCMCVRMYVCVTSWFASSNDYTKYMYHTPHKPIQTVSQYSLNAWIEYDRLLNTLEIYLLIFFIGKLLPNYETIESFWGNLFQKINFQGYYLLRAINIPHRRVLVVCGCVCMCRYLCIC